MENEKGILLGGGGREETRAELSQNEKIFFELTEFIFKGLLKEIKIMKLDENAAESGIRRDVLRIVRGLSREKKFGNLYEVLKEMDFGRIEVLKKFKEPVQHVIELERMVEEQAELLKTKRVQDIFSVLSMMPRDVTDTIKTNKESKVEIN